MKMKNRNSHVSGFRTQFRFQYNHTQARKKKHHHHHQAAVIRLKTEHRAYSHSTEERSKLANSIEDREKKKYLHTYLVGRNEKKMIWFFSFVPLLFSSIALLTIKYELTFVCECIDVVRSFRTDVAENSEYLFRIMGNFFLAALWLLLRLLTLLTHTALPLNTFVMLQFAPSLI